MFKNGHATEGTCVTTCPDGFWGNGSDCDACAAGCATCSNGTDCDSCPGDEWLDKHTGGAHVCVADSDSCTAGKKIDEEYKHCLTTCSSDKIEDNGYCIRCTDP